MKKFVIFFLVIVFMAAVKPVLADFFPADVTGSYPIVDKDAIDGDIIVSISGKGFVRADAGYDIHIFGVLESNPLIAFKSVEANTKPVVRSGTAIVNISDANGEVKKGDFVTSSEVPGKGQKAIISGQVIGFALEDFDGGKATAVTFNNKTVKVGKIPVALKIEYAEISSARSVSRLFDYFGTTFFENVKDPGKFPQMIRYIAAGIVMVFSLVFAFITFSRSVPKGIEAIGRNPLAKQSILLSMGMSILLVVVTIGFGIFASVIILKI